MTVAPAPVIVTAAAVGGVQVDMSADGRPAETFSLPADAAHLIGPLLDRLAAGQVVTLVPAHAEFTPEAAAALLGVSPLFVTRLIEQGEVPARTVGPHRRVGYGDLMAYKRRAAAAAEDAMHELTQLSQELGLY